MILLKILKGKASLKPTNLFFIELLIVLLFFGFSVAVILKIFASADYKQDYSTLTQKTVLCAESVAEAFSVSGNLSETVSLVFGIESEVYDGVFCINLDDTMKPSSEGKVELLLFEKVDETPAGNLSELSIGFTKNGKEIYSLECYAYTSFNGGDGDE